MNVVYKFVPEYETAEEKLKKDIVSYAGKLLEIVGSRTLIVGVDEDDKPFVMCFDSRLRDALDFSLIEY